MMGPLEEGGVGEGVDASVGENVGDGLGDEGAINNNSAPGRVRLREESLQHAVCITLRFGGRDIVQQLSNELLTSVSMQARASLWQLEGTWCRARGIVGHKCDDLVVSGVGFRRDRVSALRAPDDRWRGVLRGLSFRHRVGDDEICLTHPHLATQVAREMTVHVRWVLEHSPVKS
eukprot:6322588-Pyramimonas_sp.AAC.5